MQNVLVAGGAGFIGSHLCTSLINEGFFVFCLDNLISGDEKNLKDLPTQNFQYIRKDITKDFGDEFRNLEIDYIFHLASPASPNKKSPKSYISHPIETLLVNSQGTYNLLHIAVNKKAKFLFSSSSEIYGDPTESPQKEEYRGNVSPNGPRSVYDESKRFGEAITMAFHRKYGLDSRIIRIFNTYGPNMQPDDGRVVSNFINQAISNKPITVYGDGSQTRSFCYISDMIDGIKRAMFTEDTNGEVVNLGNPDEKTILELANLIKEITRSNSNVVFEDLPEDDPKKRKPDISKAKRILDWEPKVPLSEGLEKTIKYLREI
ncbi:MAG: SDR family oxidoreductase [Candidatus Levybacteria bacterium]|nr:SDR family oxidoreductase [Candidatus Levybacteria bacterium]